MACSKIGASSLCRGQHNPRSSIIADFAGPPPLDLTRAPDRDIAAAIIVVEDGRYLLQLRDDFAHIHLPAHWCLFGGSLEAGETAHEALVRELDEELGLKIEAARLLTISAQALPAVDQVWRVSFFEVPVAESVTAGLQQNEGAGRGLFTLDEAMGFDRIAPWDLAAMMIHARRQSLWRDNHRNGRY